MRSVLGIFLIIFFFGCNKSSEIPDGIISPDSMVTIMADIHVAESRLVVAGSMGTQRDVKSAYIHQVLKKAEVDTSRFLKSFDYYSLHPEQFAELYEQIVVELSKRQAEIRNKKAVK